MFTGIIQDVGKVAAIEKRGGDMRLRIRTRKMELADIALGDSIATNGVCLTVIELPGDGYWADVSGETLAHTTFGKLQVGDAVNLEKALRPIDHLGGHMVSGHVDGVGEVVDRFDDARSIRFRIQAPAQLACYIAGKGSICVEGISLTVNRIDGALFELNIVPHTLQETTLVDLHPGHRVNLEVDLIARYLERLLQGDQAAQPANGQGVTEALLAEHGFM